MRILAPRLVLLAACTVLGSACGERTTAPTQADSDLDLLLLKLATQGFDTVGVEDRGDHLIVERDIVIAKADIARWGTDSFTPHDTLAPRFQWRTTNIVSQSTIVEGMRVDLSGLDAVPDWQTAARQAMAEWNSVGNSTLYFVEGGPADITVSTFSPSNCLVAAQASWPSGGSPGNTIVVNPGFCGTNTAGTRKRNMAHELGHTIGLRHTNWQTNDCTFPPCQEGSEGAIQIAGTPATDNASVMNGSTASVSWSGFSTYDRIAVQVLYPPMPVTLAGPGYISVNYNAWSGQCTFSASANGGTPPYSMSWDLWYVAPYGPSGSFGPSTGTGSSITTRLSLGNYINESHPPSYTATVVVTDAVGRTSTKKLSGSVVNSPSGQWPYCTDW